ncbi:MAG: methyltransferase domain-containing protein [Polyangiales bacterium]
MADDLREIDTDAGRIRANHLLYEIYCDVYGRLAAEVPRDAYPRLLELGSGGGFFREFAPHAITSECVETPRVDRVIDACRIAESFEPSSLDAIVAFDVFHHLPDAAGFLRGAETVLRPGGRIVMVEPWYTTVGQYFHSVLHHEPHIDDPNDWRVVGEGRMAGANTRLPTSVFRDSDPRFAREFPSLKIVKREPFHKWLYLASGGLKLNTRIPAFLAKGLVALDRTVHLGDKTFGLFALIVVERVR